MESLVVMDNLINGWLNETNSWSKFDTDKPQDLMCKRLCKHVHDHVCKMFPSTNTHAPELIMQRIKTIRANRKQLRYLQTIPVIEQRTPEWYEARKQMITASDFGDALGIEKFGRKGDPKKFYERKCGYDPPPEFDSSSIYLKWGVMFEEVACKLYETRTGIKVHEFGVLRNPKHPFLGASPDGITDMGVMLEIKCPYKRVITEDSILKQYYFQIQGQLDACALTECDFLEVKIDEYFNEADFFVDYENVYEIYTENFQEKGIVIEVSENNFLYSPFNATKDVLMDWLQKHRTKGIVKFWNITSFSIKRVREDKCCIDNMCTQLKSVWDNVERYRKDKDAYMSECKSKKASTSVAKRKPKAEAKTLGALFIDDPNDVAV